MRSNRDKVQDEIVNFFIQSETSRGTLVLPTGYG